MRAAPWRFRRASASSVASPLENYQQPLSPWLLGAAIWQRGSAAVRNCRGMIWTLLSSKWRDLDARSRSLTQGGDREADSSRFSTRAHRIDEGSSGRCHGNASRSEAYVRDE